MLPMKLKIENFFSHKLSEIDFSLFNSALLVGSVDGDYNKSNGAGKSVVMESILWCLYNKSRATTMDDVITWGENRCEVSLHFSHINKEYMVKRVRMRSTSTSTVDLFSLDEDGSWKSLSGSTSGETNDRIVNLLKIDYKTFINSAYFRQNDISEFATSEASKKKEILKSIVDISKWDSFEKESKKKGKEIQVEIVKLQARYDALNSEVQALLLSEGELATAKESLNEKVKEKDLLAEKVEYLSEGYLKMKNNIDTASWDKATAEISSLKSSGKDLKNRFDQVISSLTKRLEKSDELSVKISSIEKKIKTLSFDPDIEKKIEKMSAEWIECSGSVQQAKIKLKELSETHIHEGKCHVCNQEVNEEISSRLLSEHSASVDHYTRKKISSEKRVQYLIELKKELEKQSSDNLVIERGREEVLNLKSRLDIITEEIADGEKEKEDLYYRMIEIKRKISENEEVLNSLKNDDFQALHDELKVSKASLESLSDDILKVGIRVGSLTEKTVSLASKKLELTTLKKAFDIKNEEMAVFDKMTKMFGKSGIQALLLEAVILDLEKTANKILTSISDQFTISLETQRSGSDGVSTVETLDLNVKKDGSLCGFSSLSGGEQFRIALSLRIALSEIATQHGGSSLEFLLLDEINSPLDKSGVETLFVNIIRQLETKYKILVITHDDSLKERFENVLDVSKINGDSSISFYNGNIAA
jgi:exonuclease SbcC